MKRKELIKRTLAVFLAVFSSCAAMGQQEQKTTPKWLSELKNRITLNGYAQAGWSHQNSNNKTTNAYNLKRTLLWAKARITDRWSFLFMHDFSSVVQEFYTDYRFTRDNSLSVRFGQFKHSYTMENPLSPTQLELIDVYSQAVLYLAGEGPDPLNGVNYGRDMGLMVYGDLARGLLHYELALMSGQGINRRDRNNQKDFIGKIEVRPTKGLRFVASTYLGTGNAVGTAAWNPDIKEGDNYRRNRYSIGAEVKTNPRMAWRTRRQRRQPGRIYHHHSAHRRCTRHRGKRRNVRPQHQARRMETDKPHTGSAVLVLQEVPYAAAIHPLLLWRRDKQERLQLASGTGAGGFLNHRQAVNNITDNP